MDAFEVGRRLSVVKWPGLSGVSIGRPLLPLLAAPAQRYLTHWLAGQYSLLTRASGVILVGIGVFGAWAEILPSL